MSREDDGGPAFPAPEAGQKHFGDPAFYLGMSLRDRFAIAALAQLLRISVDYKPLAEESYRVADAMLEARK